MMEKKPNEEKKQPEQNETTGFILSDKFREDLSGTDWYKPNGEKIGNLDAMLEWKKKQVKQKS
jgi:hypothetical protein